MEARCKFLEERKLELSCAINGRPAAYCTDGTYETCLVYMQQARGERQNMPAPPKGKRPYFVQ